jgi:hypothetical protein
VKLASWRNAALVLAAICMYQRWQSCSHGDPAPAAAEAEPDATRSAPPPRRLAAPATTPSPSLPAEPSPGEPGAPSGKNFHGFRIPAWAMHLLPQPGEPLSAYRDRIMPLAELAVAPQRARVARLRDEFAHLDAHQRTELDTAVADAAQAIQARALAALAGGELRPATFKPMTGVTLARDVLDIIDRGNTRFVGSLTSDQRTQLAAHRFDFADYLVFTTRWEDALRPAAR